MDFEKIKTDFEKRYDRKCESMYFAGENITFFEKNANRISGCLSIGEVLAVSSRGDGRINVQYSGSDSMLAFNVSEIQNYQDFGFARILIKAEKQGVRLGGGDVFIYKNSRITELMQPLILGSLSAFCHNVPPKEKLLPHFPNYTRNIAVLTGRKGSITVTDGQRTFWQPFFDGRYKIVIAHLGEKMTYKSVRESRYIDEATDSIKRGNCDKFCSLLDKETAELLSKNKADKLAGIYNAAKKTGDAKGSGIVDSGGVFFVVENEKIDIFIHNTLAEYRKYWGGSPDFYVTDFVDSGVFVGES